MPLSARVWLGMTALALSFFVRVDADASTRGAEIRGIVFQGGADSVLPGVRVTCEGCSSVTTNRDGVFLLRGLKTGAHVITLSHDGQRWTSPEITTASGHSTELLVTLPEAEGVPVFSIEAPSADLVRVVQQPEESLGSGRIVGSVVRQDKGSPLRGASIYVRGQSAEAKSDAKGRFTLELPVGAHDITVLKPGFASATKRAIEVPLDKEVSVEVRLEQVAVELQAFTVLAPTIEGSTLDLLEERKEADRFTDFIGAEEMSKSGDSSAAGALRRVTGVTLVGGKYVYVRGLGERYSSTLLDGSTLPSPEPERRVVPLDLFPTSLLDSVVVEKSYTPDRPGEFAGGVVVLRTKSFPDEFEASVGLSLGILQDSTFSAGLHGDSGPTDWLGIDGGYRALSLDVAQASAQGLVLESDRFSVGGFSSDELEMLGETLPNRWALERRSVLPDLGFDASIGTSWDFEGGSTGFLVALGYDQGWTRRLRQLKTFDVGAGGALEFQNGYDFDELNQNVTLSGMVTTGFTLDAGHEVQLTGLVARISDYDTREYEGFNGDLGGDIRITRLRWVERMLASGQLRGEHAFTLAPAWDLTLEWRYGLSLATRDEPDRREARTDYEEGDGKWYLSDRPEGNQRLFSGLEDVNHDVGVDASLSMPSWLGQTLKLKTGGAMVFKGRERPGDHELAFAGDLRPRAYRPRWLPAWRSNIGDRQFYSLSADRSRLPHGEHARRG
jgi:hypothetical protein